MSDAPWRLSACELAQGIRERRFSCVEVMESVVARIADRNPALNAIVYGYSERALVEAREADAAVAAGAVLGPLHGVPVTIKDMVRDSNPSPRAA
jgi:amidase